MPSINYNNYPILRIFNENKINDLFQVLSTSNLYNDAEKIKIKQFNNFIIDNKIDITKIDYVSKPFIESVFNNYRSLGNIIENSEIGTISGVFLIDKYICIYYFSDCQVLEKLFFCTLSKDGYMLPSKKIIFDKQSKKYLADESFLPKIGAQYFTKNSVSYNEDFLLGLIFNYLAICVLKKYAPIETRILEPNKKVKIFNCKYLNSTDIKINYLDSRWFTNLVKSEAFKVSGHFRFQPKMKNGQWIKELIWINDFMKSGYTVKARKLLIQ